MRFDVIFFWYICRFVRIAASLNFLLAFMYCPWLFTSTMTRYTIKFFVQGSVSIKCTKSKSSCKETRLLTVQTISAVFRISDISVRIRIRGYVSLTNESGLAPDPFLFVTDLFCLLLFEGTFSSFFKDKKL
jgi:hypothetical protein